MDLRTMTKNHADDPEIYYRKIDFKALWTMLWSMPSALKFKFV